MTAETKAERIRPLYQPPFIGETPFHVNRQKEGFGSHWHGELEIIYIPQNGGRAAVTVDGREFVLLPRGAAFIAGTEVHSIRIVDPDTEFLVIEMGFSLLGHDFSAFAGKRFTETAVDFSSLSGENSELLPLEEILSAVFAKCGELSGVPPQWESGDRMQMASLLFALAAEMARRLSTEPVSARRVKQLEAVTAMQSVLMYVERSYPEQITVERAAELAGYEKTRFCQLFKRAVGTSFHKYLTDRRMRAAAFLLSSTNLPISEIAETVGILQPKTFSRLARETYGLTPSELRAKGSKFEPKER